MNLSPASLEISPIFKQAKNEIRLPLDDRAYLQPIRAEDVTDKYIDGLNNPSVHQHLTEVRRNRQTRSTVEAYVGANWESATDILFGFFVEDELRGTVRLHDIGTRSPADAWIGIAIFDPSCWGQGWGGTAIKIIVKYGFDDLGLDHINAGIYQDNEASRRAFSRAGFEMAGPHCCDEFGVAERWVIKQITLRRAEHKDTEIILSWQSAPGARRFARNPTVPDPQTHAAWMKAVLSDPGRMLFIIKRNRQPAGVLRLDAKQSFGEGLHYEVSILIAPDQQGKGVGGGALEALRQQFPDHTLWADIHPQNATSLALFRKAGYVDSDGWFISRPTPS